MFAFPAEPQRPLIEMYEVKTIGHPRLDKNQVDACRQFEAMGVDVWIVKELPGPVDGLPWDLVRFEDYV